MEQIVNMIAFISKMASKISMKYWDWYLNALLSQNGKHPNIRFHGKAIVKVHREGMIELGEDIVINSTYKVCINSSEISKIYVFQNGKLKIGDGTGISATAISVRNTVAIGKNVNIGSGTIILDSDFHSLNPDIRANRATDCQDVKTKPVIIGDRVFIGARCIILKGTEIGENSVIAAGSVVAGIKIPANEIWGGNPAKFIKRIS